MTLSFLMKKNIKKIDFFLFNFIKHYITIMSILYPISAIRIIQDYMNIIKNSLTINEKVFTSNLLFKFLISHEQSIKLIKENHVFRQTFKDKIDEFYNSIELDRFPDFKHNLMVCKKAIDVIEKSM